MPFWRAQADLPVPAAADQRRKQVIVVADEDRDTRELYRAFFDLSGFRTAEAATGPQAVLVASQLVPDVLLMDLLLPDLDGLSISRMLKGDPRTSGTHVLLVTGYSFDGLDRLASDAGIARVLVKPCPPQTMLREVQRALLRPARASRSVNAVPDRHVPLGDQQHDGSRSIVNPQRQDL